MKGTGFFPPSCFYETTGPEGCLFPDPNMNYGRWFPTSTELYMWVLWLYLG